ncbi:MAG: hypothetical protein M3P43_01125 [Actinomycetota bacterium]|nr:hypothetical protein [Actinomycetota bacterium]
MIENATHEDFLECYERLTLVVRGDVVEKVVYPVFQPDGHAETVLGWIASRQRTGL